jgi:hypothetical protein
VGGVFPVYVVVLPYNTKILFMANKFIDWVDRKGVPIMTFVVSVLLTVFVIVQIIKLAL